MNDNCDEEIAAGFANPHDDLRGKDSEITSFKFIRVSNPNKTTIFAPLKLNKNDSSTQHFTTIRKKSII